jgi:alanyl-tRNA synthetase
MLSCYISKELVAKKILNAGQVVRELGKYKVVEADSRFLRF